MTNDPWTEPDPQPGDFDAELDALGPAAMEQHEGDPTATLRLARDADVGELFPGSQPGRRR